MSRSPSTILLFSSYHRCNNRDIIRHIIIQSHKRIIVGNGVEKTNLADIQKQLAGLSYDLHAGAEVRNGDVRGHVSLTEATEFVEQVTE